MHGAFPQLPAVVDLPAIEHEVLRRWREGKVFERCVEQTADGPAWVFYEGPPTANGLPGAHHIAARAVKDAFIRFRTMQGYHVPRRGGWDCHGLPVEVAVEKELGLASKRDIEDYGIAAFNDRCRESVLRHVGAFAEFTQRMGYWVDLSQAYRTMDASYIESVWWSLSTVYRNGLLVRDFRVSPYCPRCGTPLSDHEMGADDVYRTVTDPSVIVRLPVATPAASVPPSAADQLSGADLLIWTTTPWTLVANTGVAVHPDQAYVIARRSGAGDRVVVADRAFARVLGEGWHVTAQLAGRDLAGTTYRPPLDLADVPAGAHRVVTGTFVTTQEGTGLVHLAPAFGTDDLAAGREHGLPLVNPVGPDGRFSAGLPLVGGLFVKSADSRVIDELSGRGLLLRAAPHEHSYPHCWRCGTPLLYYALPSWFIRTTAIRDQLLAHNEQTTWQPPTIKHGRYGDWLRNNVDWALSRSRYWGTPLPIWLCPAGHQTCVGSLAELSELAGRDVTAMDPHRPFVDEVEIACPSCAAAARRVPDVIDVWYDSGAMPFAQHGAPFHNGAEFERTYPADFICEAVDQTRGWFYSLMAVAALVFGRPAYRSVLCLGLVTDEQGRKMSKHLGNVLEPITLMEEHGADTVRWYFAAAGSPWAARKIAHGALPEIVRKVLLTYWNTASFFVRYADVSGYPGTAAAAPVPGRPALDRWLLSELHTLVKDVTAAMDGLDPARAGRRIAGFIDDLSNWYVRRSRRRFWAGPAASADAAAFATLDCALDVLTRLMAPFTPFLTDYVWAILRSPGEPDSVHLASWPAFDPALVDAELAGQMALVRRLTELGRSARAGARVKVRQPLARALVSAAGFAALPAELTALLADELNVRVVESLDVAAAESAAPPAVSYRVRPDFRALGARFGVTTPRVAAAIAAADPGALARALREAGRAEVAVDGAAVAIGPADVIVTQVPGTGWAIAAEAGETVALDVTIGPQLRREGLARDAIRLIQEARKADGLALTDRVVLRWRARDPEVTAALAEHRGLIAAEVLAVDFAALLPDAADAAGLRHDSPGLGLTFWLQRA